MITIPTRLRTGIAALAVLGAGSAVTLAITPAADAATSPETTTITLAAAPALTGTAAASKAGTAAPATSRATAATPASLLKSVRRNCGWVTCSWYMSKRVTRNLKDMLGPGTTFTTGAAYMICSKISHPMGIAVCAAAILTKGASAAYHITAASNRGGCFVTRVNAAYVVSGIPALTFAKGVTFDDVPLSNKYCDAS
ncbi:hypothetical protein [Sphaerisporangium perillae]|uniref:hypothetical protein n=1 Tax=Sphaerisporangium perillae TaxID=2935860 RepID=UPI00200DE0F4|nr:hypothetical protein [Sphaerisporangium perillae]